MVLPADTEAVIFDLDGTLVDSMWIWKQIDIDYLSLYGIKLPENLQNSIDGMSYSETAVYFKERFGIPDSIEKIKQDWYDMSIEFYRKRVPLKTGALEFLKQLKARGIKTGIATSNSRELLETALDSLHVKEYFDSLHVACEVAKGKPSPDIYLLVADDLGIEPEKCFVFEDITQGIEAAHAAGMKACGIYDEISFERGHRLDSVADYYINDFNEIIFND
ncbi:MAG: HAD family phosphatase [Lachnospiraceae bacterium]|nr:HAD family phosphatase [Lachnospiraceae bacterium]